MKRLYVLIGGLVLGAASLMGCHHHGGYWHDPYYGQGCCSTHCHPAPYCTSCSHYHYGPCH